MCLPVQPYKIEREWEYAGLKCAVVVARENQHRCGYVRLPPTHPMYEKHYDDIPAEVHGGLTFCDIESCVEKDGKGWWIGFDCAHSGDAMYDPNYVLGNVARYIYNHPNDHYWTQAEVELETESLADQMGKLI